MKKILAILLLIIYTSSAVGITVNFHYCQGQLAKVSFLNFEGQKDCACNPQNMPKGCCKDDLVYQKADKHNVIQAVPLVKFISFSLELTPPYNYAIIPLVKSSIPQYLKDIPKRSCPEPVYLLNRVFLI